jgi:hypothetical protein
MFGVSAMDAVRIARVARPRVGSAARARGAMARGVQRRR